MTLFLVQDGEAKLENEDPSDPWGEWRTGRLESEMESPVTNHEIFCADTRATQADRLFLRSWYYRRVVPASRYAQSEDKTCGNARSAIQKSMTHSTSVGPVERLPMASKTRTSSPPMKPIRYQMRSLIDVIPPTGNQAGPGWGSPS